MPSLKKLHNKHKNCPIWIAGSDPTLETYPDSFFDDKTGMTLHMAHVKFPDATWRYANEADRVSWLMDHFPDYLAKDNIFSLPFYWKTRAYTKKLVAGGTIWFHRLRSYQPWGIRGLIDWKFTESKVRQILAGRTITWGGHGTCLHGAMFTALYLGCSEINLIGCGHGMVGSDNHFSKVNDIDKGMRPTALKKSDPVKNIPMIEQTMAIIKACEKLGIKVNWIREWTPDLSERISVDLDLLFKRKKETRLPRMTVKQFIRYLLMPLNRLINFF